MDECPDMTLVVTVADAAEILSVSTRTVHRALAKGALERVHLRPGGLRVSMASVFAWIEECTESPATASGM